MAFERAGELGDRLARLVGDVALVRTALEQGGTRRGLQLGPVAQGARVLGGGLPVGAGHRRPLGRGGREAQHGAGVVRALGVVGEARGVVAGERGQRLAVQRQPNVGRQRLLDDHAREIVPECQHRPGRAEHAARQALLEMARGLAGQRFEQRQLDRPGHDRGGVEQPPRRSAERRHAREHGVAHRRRQLEAAGGERLGHEERVARRPAVQLGGVDVVRRRQLGDGLQRQRLEPQAGRLAACELAERDAQRMPAVELVVAVAGHEQRGHGRDAAAQQPQHVERRGVGPVHVLEHDDRRDVPGEVA